MFDFYKLFNIFPQIDYVEMMNRNFDLTLRQTRRAVKNSRLSKTQKRSFEILLNLFFGNYYLGSNIFDNYKNLFGLRTKFFMNFLQKVQKGEITNKEINNLIETTIERELDLLTRDSKIFSDIVAEYGNYFAESIERKDKKAFVKYTRKYIDEQFIAGRGIKSLCDLIRNEHGTGVGTTEIYETSCLKLLQVNPIYAKGESKTDSKYIRQPLILIPPTVLGSGVLAFAPNYGTSLIHHLSEHNPVFVINFKDFKSSPMLKMTMESLIDELIEILKFVNLMYGTKPIFGGYCQGGLIALLASLSEKLNPYIKAIFAMATPTGKMDMGNSSIQSLLFKDLGLATKTVNGHKVIAKEFPIVGLKNDDWSALLDFAANLSKAKVFRKRILEMVKSGIDIHDAIKRLSIENIEYLAQTVWLNNMEDLPFALTDWSLSVFKNGICPDGSYDAMLDGKRLSTATINKNKKTVHLFYGKRDKLVTPERALEIVPHLDNCETHPIDCGHIGICNVFNKGYQEPIIEAIEKEYYKEENIAA